MLTSKTNTILGVIVISIAIIGAAIFAFDGSEKIVKAVIKKDPIITKLELYEKNQDHANLIRTLYENVDHAFSTTALTWLKKRADSGYTPYLYATARHMLITNESYQALLYYNAAGLAARIDAARCTDKSSVEWVKFLESGFSGVHKYIKSNPSSKIAAGAWALMKEETLKDRPLPAWLCINSQNESEHVPYIATELWQQERTKIRDAFQQFISNKESSLANTAPAGGQ